MGTEIEKSKIVDADATEKKENKKLSFGEKLSIFLNNINNNIKKFQEKQIERSEKELQRLERLEKKTKLEAKIAKNQAAKLKAQGGGKKNQSNDIDWLKFN